MEPPILKKQGANFYGFESIDVLGKHHYHPSVVRGCGELTLNKTGIHFRQWITRKEYDIPLRKIIKTGIRTWHNMKWQGLVHIL